MSDAGHEHLLNIAQDAASAVCHRIADCGHGSREAVLAYEEWRRAWLAWADAFDATRPTPGETTDR
jgi:hypothetical protein